MDHTSKQANHGFLRPRTSTITRVCERSWEWDSNLLPPTLLIKHDLATSRATSEVTNDRSNGQSAGSTGQAMSPHSSSTSNSQSPAHFYKSAFQRFSNISKRVKESLERKRTKRSSVEVRTPEKASVHSNSDANGIGENVLLINNKKTNATTATWNRVKKAHLIRKTYRSLKAVHDENKGNLYSHESRNNLKLKPTKESQPKLSSEKTHSITDNERKEITDSLDSTKSLYSIPKMKIDQEEKSSQISVYIKLSECTSSCEQSRANSEMQHTTPILHREPSLPPKTTERTTSLSENCHPQAVSFSGMDEIKFSYIPSGNCVDSLSAAKFGRAQPQLRNSLLTSPGDGTSFPCYNVENYTGSSDENCDSCIGYFAVDEAFVMSDEKNSVVTNRLERRATAGIRHRVENCYEVFKRRPASITTNEVGPISRNAIEKTPMLPNDVQKRHLVGIGGEKVMNESPPLPPRLTKAGVSSGNLNTPPPLKPKSTLVMYDQSPMAEQSRFIGGAQGGHNQLFQTLDDKNFRISHPIENLKDSDGIEVTKSVKSAAGTNNFLYQEKIAHTGKNDVVILPIEQHCTREASMKDRSQDNHSVQNRCNINTKQGSPSRHPPVRRRRSAPSNVSYDDSLRNCKFHIIQNYLHRYPDGEVLEKIIEDFRDALLPTLDTMV